ncbi:MAG: Npt1/Npt2 family nucleotide transporter [Candidatus Babeliales bacterium]
MNGKLKKTVSTFISADKFERLKVMLLSLTFLFVIGAYTVIYDLKSSIFMSVVGREYVPYAKMLSMIILIPAVLFYAFLVDRLRRYQLIYFYSITYGIFGLICVYLIGHPTIGIVNTDSSPYRLFGWAFYFFVEGFSPFVVSVFWAFANSISSPEGAKENYSILVAGSKMGGMFSAGLAWFLLSIKDINGIRILSDAVNHQILLLFFSCLVLFIPFVVYYLMRRVPGKYLHGYEAVYQFEKEKKEKQEEEEDKEEKITRPGLLSGLRMILERPYILGIFGMILFYEILNTILSYQRLSVAQTYANTISDVTMMLYQQMFAMHFIGFFISLFGTRTLLKRFGEPICLLLIPLANGLLLFYFWATYTPLSLMMVFVALKSVNYAFAQPVRESLYIPTIKDVKFKSKSWIDAFGAKMARGSGSLVNVLADKLGPMFYFQLHGAVFLLVIAFWFVTAYLLGNRYTRAVKHNEVIG